MGVRNTFLWWVGLAELGRVEEGITQMHRGMGGWEQ